MLPVNVGATSVAFTFTVCPGATLLGNAMRFGPHVVLSFGLLDINLCPVGAFADVANHVFVPVFVTWNVTPND